mmetsp:Transcript_6687/g.18890  ORF Transcript_6687/g.18890 Transcript_6687/m.18890 type:complete len:145 (+) Transcript_6687:45-479(+)
MKVIVMVVLGVLAVSVTAGTCGGNCPSNTCGSCPCGTSSNYVDPSSYCSMYSGWSQTCCECIANKESGGNANAMNYNTNDSFDIGLFQINEINWDSCSGGNAPCDPKANEGCAEKVFQWGGNTWSLWSTCGLCSHNGVQCCYTA